MEVSTTVCTGTPEASAIEAGAECRMRGHSAAASTNFERFFSVSLKIVRSVFSGNPFALPLLAVAALWVSGCESIPTANAPLRSPAVSAGLTSVEPINSIVLDAGHGGHDPGTSHFGLREKNLALDISRRLRAVLKQEGFSPVMTRETDQFIPLSGRPGMANRLGADLFISVHINANRNRNVSGAEVYYPRESVVSSSAQWPPSVSAQDVSIPSLTIKQILWDLVLTRTRSHSRRLASAICRSIRENMGVHCRAPKGARFVVLREAWMPAVLVEVGYVTNRVEAQQLGTAEYRQAVAEAIAKGVELYVREIGAHQI